MVDSSDFCRFRVKFRAKEPRIDKEARWSIPSETGHRKFLTFESFKSCLFRLIQKLG